MTQKNEAVQKEQTGSAAKEYKLPELPYAYDALEPYFDEQTLRIHHGKHHQGYTNNLNKALESYPDWQGKPAEELLQNLDKLPEEIRTVVRNNGGGFVNHSLFWPSLLPGGSDPSGKLAEAIDAKWETFENFRVEFAKAAVTRFGSGWAWLVLDGGELKITSTGNQDSPLSEGQIPLLGLDVWEHAYYLKYQNLRGDYVKAFWNLVNWEEVARRFDAG